MDTRALSGKRRCPPGATQGESSSAAQPPLPRSSIPRERCPGARRRLRGPSFCRPPAARSGKHGRLVSRGAALGLSRNAALALCGGAGALESAVVGPNGPSARTASRGAAKRVPRDSPRAGQGKDALLNYSALGGLFVAFVLRDVQARPASCCCSSDGDMRLCSHQGRGGLHADALCFAWYMLWSSAP